jgi:hypothetical protein
MLDRVGIPNPQTRVDDYPHQFCGGMSAAGLRQPAARQIAGATTQAAYTGWPPQLRDLGSGCDAMAAKKHTTTSGHGHEHLPETNA